MGRVHSMMSGLPDRRSRSGIAKSDVPVVDPGWLNSMTVTLCGSASPPDPAGALRTRVRIAREERHFAAASTAHLLRTYKALTSLRTQARTGPYNAFTADSNLVMDSRASPNNSVVFGSNSSSFSMPANPGRIDRFMKTTWCASPASRIGIP
jgi:hypothetical protein